MLRGALLALGVAAFAALLWHIGPSQVLAALSQLGPLAIGLILLPSVLMYVVEAQGWRVTLGPQGQQVSFHRLFMIRTAGELVNLTTPMAYLGGEPLKAYLLKREGVPLVTGMASVVTAKTTMTLAEGVFIVLGIALTVVTLGRARDPSAPSLADRSVASAAVVVGVLLLGTVLFVVVQRRGLFAGLLRVLRACRIRVSLLETREAMLLALDRAIQEFYERDRRGFTVSTALFFLGWLAEALEVYVILFFVGPPTDAFTSVSIGALSVMIKGGAFFIPGSLGAQEAGNLLLLLAYGYSDVAGMTFALLRRLRELVWIAVGVVCLAVLGGRNGRTEASHAKADRVL